MCLAMQASIITGFWGLLDLTISFPTRGFRHGPTSGSPFLSVLGIGSCEGLYMGPHLSEFTFSYLESQVAQNSWSSHPTVAHSLEKVAHHYEPHAFQLYGGLGKGICWGPSGLGWL